MCTCTSFPVAALAFFCGTHSTLVLGSSGSLVAWIYTSVPTGIHPPGLKRSLCFLPLEQRAAATDKSLWLIRQLPSYLKTTHARHTHAHSAVFNEQRLRSREEEEEEDSASERGRLIVLLSHTSSVSRWNKQVCCTALFPPPTLLPPTPGSGWGQTHEGLL